MKKGNLISSPNLSAQLLEQIVIDAKISHQRSKDGAADAVAKTYMLWIHTQSKSATTNSREWLDKAIEEDNAKITAHNDLSKAVAERVSKFKAGKLPDNDPVMAQAASEKHAKEIEVEKDRLRSMVDWKIKDWNKERKVTIAAKEGASPFNLIVKFIFSFDEPHHSDDVARYCTVLDWVHALYASIAPADSQTVFDAIKEAGGFEKVLLIQREAKNEAENSQDRQLMASAIRSDIKAVLDVAAPITSIAMTSRFAQKNVVVMIARKRAFEEGQGDQIDIISEIDLTEAQMSTAIESYGANTNIPNSSNSELVAQVLELGMLVPEGLPTQTSRDGTVSGEKAKTQRVLVFRPGQNGQPEFVVSARGADTSPVIYVRPKDAAGLGVPKQALMLPADARRRLEYLLRDRNVRRHIAISAEDNPIKKDGNPALSPMAWLSGNDVLLSQSRENATQQFYWTDMSRSDHKPLDVENFNPQFLTAIDDSDIALIVDGPIRTWDESTSPVKQKAMFLISVEGSNLLLRTGEKEAHEYKLSTPVEGRSTLTMRARDIVDIFKLLGGQNSAHYQLQGDEGGLLRIVWVDRWAEYAINMPTATREGGWQSRRVAPMRSMMPQQIAAE